MPSEDVSSLVLAWWASLAFIGVVGVAGWIVTALNHWRRRYVTEHEHHRARTWQLRLSGVYAFGCAFRAILPRADVQRICLFDSWLSSVLVGRTIATIAELSFALQWALILREASRDRQITVVRVTSQVVVPLIVIAEICSWYAVITTNFIGNAVEQSLWNVSVLLLTLSTASLLREFPANLQRLMRIWIVMGAAFVIFVTAVDVPMYVTRWIADQRAGRTYFTLEEGLYDLATRWIVTYAWSDWREEMAWMTLYFSFAVWLSISIVHTPWLGLRARPASSPKGETSSLAGGPRPPRSA